MALGVFTHKRDRILCGYCFFSFCKLVWMRESPSVQSGRSTTGQNSPRRGVVYAFIFIDIYILLFLWGWLPDSFNTIPLEIRRLAYGGHLFLANSTLHCLNTEWASEALWGETWDQIHIPATNQQEKRPRYQPINIGWPCHISMSVAVRSVLECSQNNNDNNINKNGYDLLSVYHVPHPGLSTSHALFYLIFAATLWGRCLFCKRALWGWEKLGNLLKAHSK